MNNKTKIMLGLSVLTAGTLAAGATGTFAWFTTNKTTKVTYTNIVAKSSTNKLELALGGITEDVDTGTDKEKLNYTDVEGQARKYSDISYNATASATTDVSSADGMTFKKPNWVSASGNSEKVKKESEWATPSASADFTSFYVKVTNNGSASARIYLDDKTKLAAATASGDGATEQQAKNDALAKWSRLAIVDAGETKPTKDNMAQASNELLYLFENATTGTIDKYVKGATGNDTDGYTLELATVSKQDTNGFAAVTETETRENDGYLATLTAGQSKYFLFSVWLEGTENDDQDAAVDGIINVVLNFTSTKVSA